MPTVDEVRALRLQPGVPVMRVLRVAYDSDGTAVEVCDTVMAADRYVVNVLSSEQVDLARRFSRPHADRFDGVAYRLGWAGAPLIDGCVAWLECSHHAQHRAGDHVVFIGDVHMCARADGNGLVFHEHRYATTTPID